MGLRPSSVDCIGGVPVAFPWDVTTTDVASVGAGAVGMSSGSEADEGAVGVGVDPGGSNIVDIKSGGVEVGDWLISGDCDGGRKEGNSADVAGSEVWVGDCTIVDGIKVGSSNTTSKGKSPTTEKATCITYLVLKVLDPGL
jgi:hypothetical protein